MMVKIGPHHVFAAIVLFFCLSSHVRAAVIVTEIMYDGPGPNIHKQWIEVQNTGTESVDVGAKTNRLIDKNGKHVLSLTQGSSMLAAQEVAIIAQDPSAFLAQYPTYTGTLFKSSFTLSGAASISFMGDEVSYTSAQGAKGDGNTLQYIARRNAYVAGAPTPGSVPEVPPSMLAVPAKLSMSSASTNKQAKGRSTASRSKHALTSSSSSAYGTRSLAPAATATTAVAGALTGVPYFLRPYGSLAESPWFVGFLALIAFSVFALLVIQRHYKP
jgi:hypothetical protein